MDIKTEVKEVAQRVVESFLTGEEFKLIVRRAVEVGFYAGARAINRAGSDIVDIFEEKEYAFEALWEDLMKGFK
jgi:hypothetical protein